ncbi:hypothetical protein OR16_30329 [Cupriavidus basilensis OR16]|uniref:Uncharacterized protein n=1 Tax=Cupriavidus basilensis OR16 TaxID=1127483 RepID=H1SCV5_9BURK|nr:hypothetical protein [Cupriavidus basilensis]EHP39601.1 hypothetical protein OR16_30329 [Cupriavidus basilensis OR16]
MYCLLHEAAVIEIGGTACFKQHTPVAKVIGSRCGRKGQHAFAQEALERGVMPLTVGTNHHRGQHVRGKHEVEIGGTLPAVNALYASRPGIEYALTRFRVSSITAQRETQRLLIGYMTVVSQ